MNIASPVSNEATEDAFVEAKLLYQHDPLLVLLKEKWKLHTGWVLLGSSIPPTLAFTCWIAWIVSDPPHRMHLWTMHNTAGVLLQLGVVFPALFLIYVHLPTWLAGLFNTLYGNEVIGPSRKGVFSPESYRHFVQLFTTWTDRWWWVVGAIGLIVLYLCYRVPVIELHSTTFIPFWLRCLTLAAFAPLIYVTFLSIVRIVVAFVAINWLFLTFTIRIKPLHPDGSGGLGALGRIIWLSVVMLLLDALLLYTGLISRNVSVFSSFEIYLLAVIYFALIPFVFIGWLLLPHLVMVKARDAIVSPLAEELYRLLSQLPPAPQEDVEAMKFTTDQLVELKRRIDFILETFPTWPIEIQTMARLLAALSLPALIAALAPLVPVILPLLNQLK